MNPTITNLDAWLSSLALKHGSHEAPEHGLCVMESVAYFAGEGHTDRPQCASVVITKFAMTLNDRWSDERRQKLKPFIPRIAGTNDGNIETERCRAFMCADWAVRESLPMAMEAVKLPELAARLKDLPPVTDRTSADRARDLAREARRAAYAAYAAYAAAYAAAAAKHLTQEKVDASALTLLDRLIRVTEQS